MRNVNANLSISWAEYWDSVAATTRSDDPIDTIPTLRWATIEPLNRSHKQWVQEPTPGVYHLTEKS